jgi:hypothetical protein
MRFKILTLLLFIPHTIHGQSSPDSIDVRIYNAGQYFIKTYSISVGNKVFLFKDIPNGEYSNSSKLPFIWPSNKTEATIIVKQLFRRDKLITETSQPIDHVGDTKYTSGRVRIIVTTNFKHGELWLNAVVKKE